MRASSTPWAVAALALLVPHSATSCSDFLLNASSPSTVISARTMDFEADLKTVVEVIPRGTTFQELPVLGCVECADLEWQSKYGFVALQMFGVNAAADGLNERGLSAAWLVLGETQYPTPQNSESNDTNPAKPIVTSVCSYLLGNFATVDEVRAGLQTFDVAEFDERIQVPLLHSTALGRMPLHVSVHDAQGKSLVIEFIKGKANVYDNLNAVLTNDPPLDKQLKTLEVNGFNSFPGGYGSVERFLRVSVLNHHAPSGYSNAVEGVSSYTVATEEQRGVSDALHILNTVVRPPFSEATEWNVVRDHTRRKLYIQSTQNMVLRQIDLTQLDFGNASSRHLIPVTFGDWFVDVTPALKDPENHAKTIDLPPRTELEKLLQQLLHGGGGNAAGDVSPPSPVQLEATREHVAAASPPSGFWSGLASGVSLAVVGMTLFNVITSAHRRRMYQPIADPQEVRYTA